VPNTISEQELKDLGLVYAGAIQPYASGGACHPQIKDIQWCVIYAEVVGGQVMKFGSTKSLQVRMGRNINTINQILEFQDGRSLSTNKKITEPAGYDKYKKLAPQVIRLGHKIEVWATSRSSPAACKDLNEDIKKRGEGKYAECIALKKTLNDRYKTMQCGWATSLC
jgi:hypothetical protein